MINRKVCYTTTSLRTLGASIPLVSSFSIVLSLLWAIDAPMVFAPNLTENGKSVTTCQNNSDFVITVTEEL